VGRVDGEDALKVVLGSPRRVGVPGDAEDVHAPRLELERASAECYEQAVAAAKTRPHNLTLEDDQLVANDHLDVAFQIAGRAWGQPNQTEQ